ncbi:molybdenum ABC transporter ATP-binding protein [Oceanobacter mangrovi]|uniref:molybdenum ABC transporter ATP-binding protein n=1 Tax=Oceanobacter mangrovi TaxID=2862510 RepID=UPI001FE82C8A|nr:molybdenum ABC transporter ATP-binding protein [Oceanobacter mangrovi]
MDLIMPMSSVAAASREQRLSRPSPSAPGLSLALQLQRAEFCLDVKLNLPAQGVSVLFGHSGSGKTTLLRCLAGLERADGEVKFGEQIWQQGRQWLPTHKRPLAYVFQEASLFEHLTARGNLDFAIKRVNQRQLQNSGKPLLVEDDIIEMLGIGHTLKRYPQQLSGGERQRVAIARALLSQPSLLLMDEPLASLDEQRKQEILPYLERLKSGLALPVVYVTHSIQEVARLADYLVAMDQGQAVAHGTLAETLADPHFPLQLGEEAGVVLEGVIEQRDSQWQLACIRVAEQHDIWLRDNDKPLGAAIRARILARDVSLSNSRHEDTSILNAWPVVVESIHTDKHEGLALVRVRAGDTPLLSRMTRRSVDHLQLHPGKQVWAQVKSAALV